MVFFHLSLISLSLFLDGELQQLILDCKVKENAKCDTIDHFLDEDIHLECACCESVDFCIEIIWAGLKANGRASSYQYESLPQFWCSLSFDFSCLIF